MHTLSNGHPTDEGFTIEGGKQMAVNEQVRRCIDDCDKASQRLKSFAQSTSDPHVKMSLLDGVRHIELCITECRFAGDTMQAEPGGPARF